MTNRRQFGLLAATFALIPGLALAAEIQTARGAAEVPDDPQRVVVFDMAALDTLTALGVPVVGTVDKILVPYLQDVKAEPVGTLFEPDLEAVAGLAPDLIIAGGRSATQVDALSQIAPTVDMTIGADVPEDALARLETYGRLFHKEARAAELAAAYKAKLAEVEAAAEGRGKALIIMTNGPKISAFGEGSRFGWLHSVIGLPQAVDGLKVEGHGDAVSFEFIAQTDPDWLIVVDRAVAIGQGADMGTAQATLDNDLVKGTRAWTEGHVVYLSPGPIYIASGGYSQMMGTMDEILAAFAKAGRG